MNYTKKSFSVIAAGTDTYRENWERTFRGEQKTETEERKCPKCGEPFKRTMAGGEECKNGHEGEPAF